LKLTRWCGASGFLFGKPEAPARSVPAAAQIAGNRRGGPAMMQVVPEDKRTKIGPVGPGTGPGTGPATGTGSGAATIAARPGTGQAVAVTSPAGTPAPTTDPPGHATSYLRTESDPMLGQVLAGRYLIQRKLGEGGMGAVYLATHTVLEKQVALKVLHGEF